MKFCTLDIMIIKSKIKNIKNKLYNLIFTIITNYIKITSLPSGYVSNNKYFLFIILLGIVNSLLLTTNLIYSFINYVYIINIIIGFSIFNLYYLKFNNIIKLYRIIILSIPYTQYLLKNNDYKKFKLMIWYYIYNIFYLIISIIIITKINNSLGIYNNELYLFFKFVTFYFSIILGFLHVYFSPNNEFNIKNIKLNKNIFTYFLLIFILLVFITFFRVEYNLDKIDHKIFMFYFHNNSSSSNHNFINYQLYDPTEGFYDDENDNDDDNDDNDNDDLDSHNLNNELSDENEELENINDIINIHQINLNDIQNEIFFNKKLNISTESLETIKLNYNTDFILKNISLSKTHGELYNEIIKNKNNLSFFNYYLYLIDLLNKNEINENNFKYFVLDLIKETLNQDQFNYNIYNYYNLKNLTYDLKNYFFYFNGKYSIVVHYKNKIYLFEYKAYYWDTLMHEIRKTLQTMNINFNNNNIEYHLQKKLLSDLQDNKNNLYLGKKINDSNNILIPLQRKIIIDKIINGRLNNQDLLYYLNLNNINLNINNNIINIQPNNSLLFWNNFDCFTLKVLNHLFYIDCDNKFKLYHYIQNEKFILTNLFIDFLKDQNYFYLYEDININNVNEKILDFFNRMDDLILNDEVEDKKTLHKLGLENYKLRILSKIIKNDNIPNLDKSLIQNQNNIIFCNKSNIKFPLENIKQIKDK
jgi:hypothetical protein